MRKRSQKQLYFRFQSPEIDPRDELSVISNLLESLPKYDLILDKVLYDLTPDGKEPSTEGRKGMTAEQVLRAGIIKNLREYSYRELAHGTNDSISIRDFIKIEPCKKGFFGSPLHTSLSFSAAANKETFIQRETKLC